MILGAIAMVGCASRIHIQKLGGSPQKHEAETYLAAFDATTRGSVVHVDRSGELRVISEVPPDAVIASVVELSTKAAGQLSPEASAHFAESVTALGKRTAAVNILRDALYRLGEMQSNGTLTPETVALFEKIVQAAVNVTAAEEQENRARLAQAMGDLIEAMQASGLEVNASTLEGLLKGE
jgi:hypothetical protein